MPLKPTRSTPTSPLHCAACWWANRCVPLHVWGACCEHRWRATRGAHRDDGAGRTFARDATEDSHSPHASLCGFPSHASLLQDLTSHSPHASLVWVPFSRLVAARPQESVLLERLYFRFWELRGEGAPTPMAGSDQRVDCELALISNKDPLSVVGYGGLGLRWWALRCDVPDEASTR